MKIKGWLFFLLLSYQCFSQNVENIPALELKKISTKEGISNRIVSSISQDKKGLIWVGTEDGINRLDGHRIKQFFYNKIPGKGIINNAVNNIFNAGNNQLWISCVNGVCFYDDKKNIFTEPDASHKTNLHKSFSPHFCKIDNTIWVIVEGGAYKIGKNFDATFYPIIIEEKYHNLWNRIFDVCTDKNGNVWANYGRYILQLDKLDMHVLKVIELKNKQHDGITKIATDKNNNLWCSTWGAGIIKVNTITNEQFQINLKEKIVHDIVVDENNNRVIAARDNGYAIIDNLTHSVSEYNLNTQCNAVFVDANNNIWFGTSNGVLLNEYKNYFIHKIPLYTTLLEKNNKLFDNKRLPITFSSTSKSYFVGLQYANGIIEFDKQWKFKKYVYSLNGDDKNIRFRDVKKAYEKNNNLWVLSDAGLSKCNENLEILKHFKPNFEKNYKHGGIEYFNQLQFINDSLGILNSAKSFSVFDFKNEKFVDIFISFSNGKVILTDNNITDFVLYNNDCYFTTEDGLYKLNFKNRKVYPIKLLLSNSRLTCIEYIENNLWIGSQNGLQKLDLKTNEIQSYYRTDGLGSDHILDLKKTKENALWIATTNGLSYFDKYKNQFRNWTEKNGLEDNLIEGLLEMDDNNNIVVGNINLISIIQPSIIVDSKEEKNTIITELMLHDTSVSWTYKNQLKYIELESNNNSIGIHFSTVGEFEESKKYYKLNNQWYSIKGGFLQLSNLNDGEYFLEVSNKPIDSKLNDKLLINILPPFYKKGWFWLLIILFISFVFYKLYQMKNKAFKNKVLLQKSFEEKLKDAEMQTLRSQMNPHFMFNSINSINSYILLNKTEEASAYLTTFSKLMRNILENSKHKFITLQKEMDTLKWYLELEAVRLEHKFDYKILYKNFDELESIKIPPLILQPFVENAIWHGIHKKKTNGSIIIEINNTNDLYTEYSIIDDGIGRDASNKLNNDKANHKSFGIETTINRLKTLNNKNDIQIIDLMDNENISLGTKVNLKIWNE